MSSHRCSFLLMNQTIIEAKISHCLKSVRIRSFSGPYFPAFGLNMERYSVSLRIQSACGKIRTRKTPTMRILTQKKLHFTELSEANQINPF